MTRRTGKCNARRQGAPREAGVGHAVTAVLAVAVVCLAGAAARAEAPRPNLIVILVDDLGYGDLACYGARDMQTPHVDGLMARGMRCDNFYANCPVCSPTRAALLTGRYPELVGVPGVIRTRADDNWGHLHRDAVLLPQLLAQAGYRTAIVGKWHLGLESPNTPNERGFQLAHCFLGDMMDDYFHHRRHDINYLRFNDETIEPVGHATELFTDWACAYLRTCRAGEPFFLYLAYNAPHSPIQPPDYWLQQVRKRSPELPEKRAKLVALIEHLDDGIGQVLRTLRETGLERETLVVFTSDNGGELAHGASNGALRGSKGSMYEGGLKVPACAVWPGQIAAGSRSEFPMMTMDLFPTLLEAAGAAVPAGIDGVSVLPTWRGRSQPELRESWFFQRREGGTGFGGKTIEAVRMGDWKLLQNSPFGPQELYNLRTDPLEEKNVIDAERQVFAKLSAALRRQIQRGGAVPWQRGE